MLWWLMNTKEKWCLNSMKKRWLDRGMKEKLFSVKRALNARASIVKAMDARDVSLVKSSHRCLQCTLNSGQQCLIITIIAGPTRMHNGTTLITNNQSLKLKENPEYNLLHQCWKNSVHKLTSWLNQSQLCRFLKLKQWIFQLRRQALQFKPKFLKLLIRHHHLWNNLRKLI